MGRRRITSKKRSTRRKKRRTRGRTMRKRMRGWQRVVETTYRGEMIGVEPQGLRPC